MVRPGLKRLREAQNVKVQPNKTGTSFMQGQKVFLKNQYIDKRGVVFNSNGNTPYNDLPNNKVWAPNPMDISGALQKDGCCKNIRKKVWPTDVSGNIIPKSWNFSWQ